MPAGGSPVSGCPAGFDDRRRPAAPAVGFQARRRKRQAPERCGPRLGRHRLHRRHAAAATGHPQAHRPRPRQGQAGRGRGSGPHVPARASTRRRIFWCSARARSTIPLFLADLAKGVASGMYCSSERADMARAVVPRFDLIHFADYLQVGIQFSRGCPFNCEFCDITELFGRKPRCKAPHQILAELQALYDLGYRGLVDLVDDNFIGSRPQVVELLQAMQAWSESAIITRSTSAPKPRSTWPETSSSCACCSRTTFASSLWGSRARTTRCWPKPRRGRTAASRWSRPCARWQPTAWSSNGGFILGFDHETEHTARNMSRLIQESGIVMAMVGGLYALPGTAPVAPAWPRGPALCVQHDRDGWPYGHRPNDQWAQLCHRQASRRHPGGPGPGAGADL